MFGATGRRFPASDGSDGVSVGQPKRSVHVFAWAVGRVTGEPTEDAGHENRALAHLGEHLDCPLRLSGAPAGGDAEQRRQE